MAEQGNSTEGYVQVPPDSTGKQIRNLEVTILQPGGTYATVEMQVVSIADKNGNVISFDQLAVLNDISDSMGKLLKAFCFANEIDPKDLE